MVKFSAKVMAIMNQRKTNPGSRLTRARQARKLTREDVAQRLGISLEDVRHLDYWRLSELSASLDAKQTLRRYTLLLGLDPVELSLQASEFTRQAPTIGKKSLVALSRTTGSLVTLLLLGAIGGFLLWRTLTAVAVPQLSVDAPEQGLSVTSPTLTVSGRASEQAKVFINGTSVLLEPNGSFNSEMILAPGPNTLSVVAVNALGRQTTVERIVIYQTQVPRTLDEQR